MARTTIAIETPTKTVPWTCELAESLSPSGLHRSHRPTSRATGAPHLAHGWVGIGRAGGTGVAGAVIAPSMVPPSTTLWAATLPAVRGVDEGVDVGCRAGQHDGAIGARLVPALPGLDRRGDPARVSDRRVAQPVALEPDVHPLVLAPPDARGQRLEVERQVRLEVVVERRPAIADATRQPGAGGFLATDDDRGRRHRHRIGRRVPERVVRGFAGHGSTCPQRSDDRDGFLEPCYALGDAREIDAVR